ncbi:hypothetical protein [Bradyrhizobium sp.]|uniref:hypothetical protein n=1 Tax=Bradyrhizobium sp. TaxID=376 RepID=UPI00260311C4|nr:hypothetical protein [Bradyrhizobium sp.]
MISVARIQARDRRQAAIHEAGHYVIGRWRGVGIQWPMIWPTKTPDLNSEKTWVGHVQFTPNIRISAENGRLIGVAGAIAENFTRDP